MLAFSISLDSAFPRLLSTAPADSSPPSRYLAHNSTANCSSLKSQPSPHRLTSPCFCSDSSQLDDGSGDYNRNEEDVDCFVDEEAELLSDEGAYIEIQKLGRNSRRIRSKISIDATLDAVWNVLTDYEKLSDFIPSLAVSRLVEKKGNCARLYQVGQQNLAFGLKFNAKGLLDCYEKDLEISPSGQRREIEFKMIEGDFELFEGKWSIEEPKTGNNKEASAESSRGEPRTTLSYVVDAAPKLWLPIRLVEGRLCREIKTNLVSIREEAQKVVRSALSDL